MLTCEGEGEGGWGEGGPRVGRPSVCQRASLVPFFCTLGSSAGRQTVIACSNEHGCLRAAGRRFSAQGELTQALRLINSWPGYCFMDRWSAGQRAFVLTVLRVSTDSDTVVRAVQFYDYYLRLK